MVAVDRLVSAGICPEFAVNVAIWFHQKGDMDGLEVYVQEIESRYEKGATLHPAFTARE